jgi:hypothetical protein
VTNVWIANARARERRQKMSATCANLGSAIERGEDRAIMQQLWNDPKDTIPLASFAKKERREISNERREDERRATEGERRTSLTRTIRAIFKL